MSGSTSEQITQASQMVLQFDSFLAGGWIVGFFFFWGNFGKDLRELRRLGYVTEAHSSKELAEYFKEESWEQNMRISTGVFAILALGIVNFVASGFCAVGAVLSTNGTLLVLACIHRHRGCGVHELRKSSMPPLSFTENIVVPFPGSLRHRARFWLFTGMVE